MAVVSGPPRAVYAAAVETLAGSVVRALTGAGGAFRLADQFWPGADRAECRAGLAAVRVLGPDALAPFMLAAHRFDPDDAEVVTASIATFPTYQPGWGPEDDGNTAVPVRALRDWATGQVLTRLGVPAVARTYPGRAGTGIGRQRGWVAWAAVLAQLSPLASPGLDGPLFADARRYRLDVARGVTRSMLRRDYLTAARLTRWLAACGEVAMDPPFALQPVLRQVELVAEPDPRLLLEITMARYGLGGGVGE
ncbi:MAG: hypothetical protein M3460_14435 [Actinomycetota bacterium]|nr:hypothetical protein [Actinomycetota bacterium]